MHILVRQKGHRLAKKKKMKKKKEKRCSIVGNADVTLDKISNGFLCRTCGFGLMSSTMFFFIMIQLMCKLA